MKTNEIELQTVSEKDSVNVVDSVRQYLKDITVYPLLSKGEEIFLATEVAKGNNEARQMLINSNLRYVVTIAKRFKGRGLSFLDLIQEGNIGLIKAVDKFDVTKGVRFSTYATYWIRAYIEIGIIEKRSTIRIPSNMFSKVWAYQNTSMVLESTLGREPTEMEVAKYLKISIQEASELGKIAINLTTLSLDRTIDSTDMELGKILPSTGASDLEDEVFGEMLLDQVRLIGENILTPREKEVLSQRLTTDQTLESIGRDLGGITRERVRQLEAKGLKKLKEATRPLIKR